MKCSNCFSTDIENDLTHGDLRCTNCGTVLDESQIASEVTFNSHAVVGTFVSNGGRSLRTAKGFSRDSHELTLSRAQREIQILANNMKLPQKDSDAAFRIYTLAQQRNFIQGRKSLHVIAASLYIVCRQQKSAHLLIDFSDTVGVDLFLLGTVYRKLVKLLHLQVPLIDPSLFIHRFCAKLEFDDKTNKVTMTANRIVQRMRRDWMSSGRRPTGLCGAAILISARYHGFKRSTQQILQVVRVCNDTIRKRLEEFEKTLVASLTREEFENLDLENSDLGESFPPSFKPFINSEKKAIENSLAMPIKTNPEEESLSDVDENEINEFILSPEESLLKSIMWHQLNSDWIEKQNRKKELTEPKIKKKRKRRTGSFHDAKTPAEALKMSGKLSNKMKIEAVEQLFNEDNDYKYNPLL
jgi:transcription factor IIIB 90 kDa subunit